MYICLTYVFFSIIIIVLHVSIFIFHLSFNIDNNIYISIEYYVNSKLRLDVIYYSIYLLFVSI